MADRDYVEIRPARIDDLAAIFHLGERVFTAQRFTNLYRTWDEYEVTWHYHSDPDLILVAEADAQVVGFAMGTNEFYKWLEQIGVHHVEFQTMDNAKRAQKSFLYGQISSYEYKYIIDRHMLRLTAKREYIK